ncbi:MAG TPA: hypothetical protein VG838_04530 [Opitutaceae bacterium]|nr:hypothetical protein [Opitutaceae bacterium]
MKISNLLLGASLAANVALVAGFMLGAWNPSAAGDATSPSRPASTSIAATPDTGPLTPEIWTALQTTDLAVQRDRLQAEGFPPAMIRDILAAQIRENFAARQKALENAHGEIPFWKNQLPDPETQAALRALAKEQQKMLTDLLGPDPENGRAATLQRRLPNLSADKISQLVALQDDYADQRNNIYSAQGVTPSLSPADREKLAALDKAQHADIAALLTPQELEDYDLRTSNTASQLRNNLVAFDATEQEFRTLFQLQQAFNDRVGPLNGPMSQDEMKARAEGQKQLNDDIKAALGDDRYAEYQRATDYSYRQTSQLVTRLQLPPEATNQVYAVQQDIQQRVGALRSDRSLTAADRSQQLAALNEETKTRVSAVLGDAGFEAYKQYGGTWMQTLQPPRQLPPPRSP